MPLHPAIVHFPIALLPVALAIDVAALVCRRPEWHRTAYLLLVLGTLGAAAAVISGNQAAAPYRQGDVDAPVQYHDDLGSVSFLIFLVATLGRLPAYLQPEVGRRIGIWVLLSALGVAALWLTSTHGGELVYDRGVGVTGGADLNSVP
ncbi:MAG: DUF2231 domain-containing protein [Candidatus Latescibacterota bacterium]|nr:DUF2231 domain-containing protein [Candidatus Latescibacterota bacterium]